MRIIAALTAFLYLTNAHAAAGFVESGATAPGPAGPLKGTMLSPRKAAGQVVLIIPGSGPTDRDGNNPLGVRAYTYKLLAEGFAAKGITSVRVDKRGMFGSSGAVADANAVTIDDYAHDVHSWVQAIRTKTEVSCVWVAGHSEGGLAAIAASREPRGICGLILLASPGRPAAEILREQIAAEIPEGPVKSQAFKVIGSLESGHYTNVRNMHPALLTLFRPEVQGFVISLLALDPARAISSFNKPVLIVQGEKDLQVSKADAGRLASAAPHATLMLLPSANHMLKPVTGSDKAANMAAYVKPYLPLADNAAERIAEFILANPSTY